MKTFEYYNTEMVLLIVDDITETEKQKELIKKKSEHLLSSIRYAQRIQNALLPSENELSTALRNYFLIYHPKDIIGGDFYRTIQTDGKTIIAVGDCTGHGIPGALLTMLGISALNEIVKARNITEPVSILENLRRQIINELSNDENLSLQDGIDISICTIDHKEKKLLFAGANNDILFIHADTMQEIKGNRMPVGIYLKMNPFTQKVLPYTDGDIIYLFSDGYRDQFGGEHNKKLGYRKFKEIIQTICSYDMATQKYILESHLKKWQKDNEQVDDIVVMGIRLK